MLQCVHVTRTHTRAHARMYTIKHTRTRTRTNINTSYPLLSRRYLLPHPLDLCAAAVQRSARDVVAVHCRHSVPEAPLVRGLRGLQSRGVGQDERFVRHLRSLPRISHAHRVCI